MKKILVFPILLLCLTQCSEEATPEPIPIVIESVSLNIVNAEMTWGDTVRITPTIHPMDVIVNEKIISDIEGTVRWESDNPSVAVVSQDGVITAVGTGTCSVIFNCGTKAAKASVTVRHFDKEKLIGNWISEKGDSLYLGYFGQCYYNTPSINWNFDGMRLAIHNEMVQDTLIVTQLSKNDMTCYNATDKKKTKVVFSLVPTVVTDDMLFKNIIVTTASGDSTITTVDMGTGVLWALSNLGASAPGECGDYYTWGDTKLGYYELGNSYSSGDYIYYPLDAYLWYNNNTNEMTKYNDFDMLTEIEPSDDAVTSLLGTGWSIPSQSEYETLIKSCGIMWANYSGVEGVLFTSLVKGYEGNCLFFPFGTSFTEGPSTIAVGEYWSSTLDPINCIAAKSLIIQPFDGPGHYASIGNLSRYTGHCIRGIYKH
ncbi:MAG: Ig-like domain-containing protein [Bacteroidaceae bacterium]|nr:Ig-like domain-containing protein [Bacteroidaceae bacterium]